MHQSDDSNEGMEGEIFSFFNEIGIISQLSSTLLARTLPEGLHPSHFSILNHLYRLGDAKAPVDIASAMQVTKNTMTHSLRVLSDRKLIEVKPNPRDARAKLVFLTDRGREFRDRSIKQVIGSFRHIFEPEHIELMQSLKDGLVKIRKHLDENRS